MKKFDNYMKKHNKVVIALFYAELIIATLILSK